MPLIVKSKKTESRLCLSVYIENSGIKLKITPCSRYICLGFKYYIAKDSFRCSRYLKARGSTYCNAYSPLVVD
jgi:hypothetical protein